jgi:hypothetical protein
LKLTIKEAVAMLGDAALEAITKEVSSLVGRKTFEPCLLAELTADQLRRVIPSSTFLKEKYTPEGDFDKLKARLVGGGNHQDDELYGREDTESPTVATTSVFNVAAIAAQEGRAVATVDFPAAYLHADLPADGPEVLMRLNKFETDVLCKVAPEYRPTVDPKRGTVVVRLRKGLYGLVQSAKLWYDKLSGELESLGFVRNPADMCVFNRAEPGGGQATLTLHVDDMLITAASEQRIDALLEELGKMYSELTVHRGRELDYLGMHFSWSTPGKVRITMPLYTAELLEYASEFTGTVATPADNDLFVVGGSSLLDAQAAARAVPLHRVQAVVPVEACSP